jgi:putative membrane protein
MVNWFGYYKALHLIFMVSWFAGLFYMVRLFVYYAESEITHKELAIKFKEQYLLMQKRLWFIISWPAMLLTLLFGVLMLIENPFYLGIPWMHVKLTFVALLVFYHLLCHLIYKRQKNGVSMLSSTQLRILNEVATLFLVIIIFIVVLKNQLDGFYGTVGFIVFGLVLFIAVKAYKKLRKNK